MIQQGNKKVNDAYVEVGFKNLTRFYSAYKKQYVCPLIIYRLFAVCRTSLVLPHYKKIIPLHSINKNNGKD
jgi:AraC-like DNA-binding protein